MLNFMGGAVLGTDTDANITYMNSAAEILTGFSRQEALGQRLLAACVPRTTYAATAVTSLW